MPLSHSALRFRVEFRRPNRPLARFLFRLFRLRTRFRQLPLILLIRLHRSWTLIRHLPVLIRIILFPALYRIPVLTWITHLPVLYRYRVLLWTPFISALFRSPAHPRLLLFPLLRHLFLSFQQPLTPPSSEIRMRFNIPSGPHRAKIYLPGPLPLHQTFPVYQPNITTSQTSFRKKTLTH